MIDKLYPPFAVKVRELERRCRLEGIPVKITHGVRTWPEQGDLFAKGRTEPGPRVTNARPGKSWHNYGVSGDFCFQGPDPYLDPKSLRGGQLWGRFGAIAKDLGLVWGGDWGWDYGHVRLAYGVTLDEAQKIHREGGMTGVWAEFDHRIQKSLEA